MSMQSKRSILLKRQQAAKPKKAVKTEKPKTDKSKTDK